MGEINTISDKLSGLHLQASDAGGRKVLTGRILASPYPQGRIRKIKMPPVPEGLHYVVAGDIPGQKKIQIGGVSIPLLAGRRITWQGQPILAACARNADSLEQWMAGIELDCNQKDIIPGTDTEFHRSKGDYETCFLNAHHTVEETFTIPRNDTELCGATCLREANTYSVHSQTSWPEFINKCVSKAIKIPVQNITVEARSSAPSVASHADIWHPAIMASIIALLSWKTKKSIRLNAVKGSGIFTPQTPGAEIVIKAAVNNENKIDALKAELTILTGAFCPFEKEIVDHIILGLFSVYPCEQYHIKVHIHRSPEAPATFGPGAGFEIGFFAGELLASRIAEDGMQSASLWRKEAFHENTQFMGPGIIQPKSFPLPELLDKVMALSDYERKITSFESIRRKRHSTPYTPNTYKGVGLSNAWVGNGFLNYSKDLCAARLSATMEINGELTLSIPFNPSDDIRKSWYALASKILGINPDSIHCITQPPEKIIENGPSILGRTVSVYTNLLTLACNNLAKRRFREALPIHVERVKKYRSSKEPWNPESFEGNAFENYSWGAAVSEVHISPFTCTIEFLKVYLFLDAGKILSSISTRTSVENSVEQAIYWCIGRENPSLIPHIDITFLERTSTKISKDASTVAWLTIPAALMQALRQASGVNINTIPATSELMRELSRSA